jgi:hypothetical protein
MTHPAASTPRTRAFQSAAAPYVFSDPATPSTLAHASCSRSASHAGKSGAT